MSHSLTRLLLTALLAILCAARSESAGIPGFEKSPFFDEQGLVYTFDPGVKVTINAPADSEFDPTRPTRLVLYALPNGNTTEQTIGRTRAEGINWHFDIQHIGAQTRVLRKAFPDRNIVVAYVEADTKSWPAWRKAHTDYPTLLPKLIDSIKERVGVPDCAVTLSGHSGGGSFIIGCLNSFDAIPDSIERIAFLDANYAYSDDEKHGEKLLAWLKKDTNHHLVVIAYDDRSITLDGKPVVGPTGGTFRATYRMIDHWKPEITFTESEADHVRRLTALDGQLRFLIHLNPDNKILHTTMVGEMNGFIYALTCGTPQEDVAAHFATPRVYEAYIQGGAPDAPAPTPAAVKEIPPRPAEAITGSAFIAAVKDLPLAERERRAVEEISKGNIPGHLRTLAVVNTVAVCLDGVKRTATINVLPDYLAIGSDTDFVRMPLTPYTAQALGEQFGFTLPTCKVVDLINAQAKTRLEPIPLTEDRESVDAYLRHNQLIEEKRAGQPAGLIDGIKKDVVLTTRLKANPGRVAIYGWYRLSGKPIQPLFAKHAGLYVDYSHGVRFVRNAMQVDGKPMLVLDVLKDPNFCDLLSGEGPIDPPRYEPIPKSPTP